MGFLTDPFRFGFMQTGLAGSILVGIVCACLGAYVVVRRMAFIGDAVAHTTLPGLVIAYLRGWNLFLGALVAGVLVSFGIGWLTRRETLREDTAIGIVFTGMFALGILLASTIRTFRDFTALLFGNVLGISPQDLLLIGGVTAVVLLTLTLFHKELELTSFDVTYSQVIGIPVERVRYGLLLLLSLAVVTGIQAVGVVLTSALLVTPAAAASLLTYRLPRMMVLASVFAVASSIAGLYASYYLRVASGAAIVLACVGCFAIAWILRTIREQLGLRGRSAAPSLPAGA